MVCVLLFEVNWVCVRCLSRLVLRGSVVDVFCEVWDVLIRLFRCR